MPIDSGSPLALAMEGCHEKIAKREYGREK